nr:uncharacterized protein LOC113808622 [Penaeus vannamei]
MVIIPTVNNDSRNTTTILIASFGTTRRSLIRDRRHVGMTVIEIRGLSRGRGVMKGLASMPHLRDFPYTIGSILIALIVVVDATQTPSWPSCSTRASSTSSAPTTTSRPWSSERDSGAFRWSGPTPERCWPWRGIFPTRAATRRHGHTHGQERGQVLHEGRLLAVHAPPSPLCQNPVTALTWGHNDKRVFVATGAQLHIGRVSRRVASLQLLCRLAIKSRVSEEDKVAKLPLPRRLRALVTSLYTQTIRCYIPETRQLRDFVSRPPCNSQRLHCTMIRHDEDLIPTPGACYTLYLEYLGGLVPLLKGKRTSKIRPEFVIFDPQVDEAMNKENGDRSCGGVGVGVGVGGVVNGHPVLSDTSDTEYEDMCASPRLQRRRKLKRRIRERLESETDELVYLDTLPEQHRLVEVTSNIWGTKFKLHGVASSLPANLGQITYKTSLLHLQPRQMTLVITELREDIPPRPDPTFNPNVFSEDEEDLGERLASRRAPDLPSDVPPIAPMTPRRTPSSYSRQGLHTNLWDAPTPAPAPIPPPTELASVEGKLEGEGDGGGGGLEGVVLDGSGGAALLRELEEHPYVDLATPEMLQLRDGLRAELRGEAHAHHALAPTTASAAPTTNHHSQPEAHVFSLVRSSAPSSPKHSVSHFCCDAGTLQSPKNIVAPIVTRHSTAASAALLEIGGGEVGLVGGARAGIKTSSPVVAASGAGRTTSSSSSSSSSCASSSAPPRHEELRLVSSDNALLLHHFASSAPPPPCPPTPAASAASTTSLYIREN